MPRPSRSRVQLSEDEKKKRRREQKKLSMRRARQKLTQAELEERRAKDKERYHKKKAEGKIKTIKDYTPREQRNIRKIWRERAKVKRQIEKEKKRAVDFLQRNTPPSSPVLSGRSRVSSGKNVRIRNMRKMKAENEYLRKKLKQSETVNARQRMRIHRLNKKLESKPPSHDSQVTRATMSESNKEDRRAIIQDFYLQDENSRQTSGKKETITRKKVKKQIRLLSDSMLNLHKTFTNKTGIQISYETFRRYRPFWVLIPKVNARNTCLCAMHTNNDYIVQALHNAKVMPYKSATDLIKHLCCGDVLNVACLERTCSDCTDKMIISADYEDEDVISYERWVTKNVTKVVEIRGKSKTCKKTIKEKVMTTKRALVQTLESNLPAFMRHVANMIHQMNTIRELKQQLSPAEGLLHIDFSENYNSKYGEEVQSAHYGGSKPQLSLHTSVYYYTESEPPENYVKTASFCTISAELRHDPVLICVHLKTLIEKIRSMSPNLEHLHILSDGPLTQYRNKHMFHLIATYLCKEFAVSTITWHYSEKGHGKGAPDGVGGCVKRTADSLVARGNDITGLQDLVTCLKDNCKGIDVNVIDENYIPEVQSIVGMSTTRPFRGTLSVHQVTWSLNNPSVLQMRRLSCLICAAHRRCPHFGIGEVEITLQERPVTPVVPEILAPDTPNASTAPNSPGFYDRITPDIPTYEKNSTPLKKITLYGSDDSNNSIQFSSTKRSILAPLRMDNFVASDSENRKPVRRRLRMPSNDSSCSNTNLFEDNNENFEGFNGAPFARRKRRLIPLSYSDESDASDASLNIF